MVDIARRATGRGGLRILAAGISWPPETFLARLFRGLAEAGVAVDMACDRVTDEGWSRHPNLSWLPAPSWDRPLGSRLRGGVGMALRAAAVAPGASRFLSRHWRGTRGVADRVRLGYRLLPFAGRSWDVIYFPWNSAAIAHRPLFDLGCPVVVSCRGSQINVAAHNPERSAIRDGLRETFDRATSVHCVSEAILREAVGFGLDGSKARVIVPAVDPEVFRPSRPRDDEGSRPLRMISTGSLSWIKGYEYLFSAIRLLLDRGVAVGLDVIGRGPERQRLLYAIDDLGLVGVVRLVGALKPAEVCEVLRGADAFVLPSLSEGISNAVLEAMACGLPVVTTDCGGMREAVTDGVEGFVVPVRDPGAMATAIEALAASPELRRRLGAAGRRRIVARHSLADQVDAFRGLFSEAAGRGGRRCES